MLEQNSYSNTVGVPDDMSSRITGLFETAFSASGAATLGAGPREPANENEVSGFRWLDQPPHSRPDVTGTRTYGYDAHGLSVSPAAKLRVLELA